MKKIILLPLLILCIVMACKKDKVKEGIVINGNIKQTTETVNGITYRLFTDKNLTNFKGILVMGSGNNEAKPKEGSIDGAAETAICEKAAANGYAAAIVQYRKTPGNDNWNESARMIGEDYDKCIVAISTKYNVSKNKAVVGGYSYATYMLFTNISAYTTLQYTKGVLGACGGSGAWNAQNFKIPIFAINCSGNNEGEFYGKGLYDQIPANSPIKAKSEGITDNSCNTHCGGNWTDRMYTKMAAWLN